MSHRISRERAWELYSKDRERGAGELRAADGQQASRREMKKTGREEKKKSWLRKMRGRGGLKPRKAKRWGDDCSVSGCEKWVDGTCQYPERDDGKCYYGAKT